MTKVFVEYLNIDSYEVIDSLLEETLIKNNIKYIRLKNGLLAISYKIKTIDGLKIYPIIKPKEYFENCLNNWLISVQSNIFRKRRNN